MGYSDNKKKKRSASAREDASLLSVMIGCVKGALIAIASALPLCLVGTLAAYSNDDPDKVMPIAAFLIVYTVFAMCGFAAVKLNGTGALKCGLISGGMLLLFMLVISLFFKRNYSSGYTLIQAVLIRAGALFMSVIGGYAGIYKRPSRRRKRK